MRAFVSHGLADRVLGSMKSRELANALKAHGHEVQFVTFPGDHTIPDLVVQQLEQFLGAPAPEM